LLQKEQAIELIYFLFKIDICHKDAWYNDIYFIKLDFNFAWFHVVKAYVTILKIIQANFVALFLICSEMESPMLCVKFLRVNLRARYGSLIACHPLVSCICSWTREATVLKLKPVKMPSECFIHTAKPKLWVKFKNNFCKL
jgi:hypothetical protein